MIVPISNQDSAELTKALKEALAAWIGVRHGSTIEQGVKISGPDIDAILNALVIFSAANVAIIHNGILDANIVNNIHKFNDEMISSYTDHFEQVLTKYIITGGEENEQPTQ